MLRNRLGSTLALYGVHQTTVVESGLASMAQAESNVEDRVRAHWLRVPQEVIWAGREERRDTLCAPLMIALIHHTTESEVIEAAG